jgi:hypothetical protein
VTYESNVLFAMRFMVDKAVVGGNWVELPAGESAAAARAPPFLPRLPLRPHSRRRSRRGADCLAAGLPPGARLRQGLYLLPQRPCSGQQLCTHPHPPLAPPERPFNRPPLKSHSGKYQLETGQGATYCQLEAHIHHSELISHPPEGACR